MSKREQNLHLIGGNSPLFLASIKKNGTLDKSLKKYGLEMYIARHGEGLSGKSEDGCHTFFRYDRALRKLRSTIPKKQSIEMICHYIYHLKMYTPDGKIEFRPNYGAANFIQGMEAKK